MNVTQICSAIDGLSDALNLSDQQCTNESDNIDRVEMRLLISLRIDELLTNLSNTPSTTQREIFKKAEKLAVFAWSDDGPIWGKFISDRENYLAWWPYLKDELSKGIANYAEDLQPLLESLDRDMEIQKEAA